MLNPNPTLRFTDPCLFATFRELFADMPAAKTTPPPRARLRPERPKKPLRLLARR